MLGYIKPVKAQLKVWEWEAYQGIYCGLCKELGRNYGQLSRMTLSYDFVFLAVLSMALQGEEIAFCRETCIAHPLKRRSCCKDVKNLPEVCTVAMILMYHKVKDNLADGGFLEKMAAACAMPFVKKAYQKAAAKQPQLAALIAKEMRAQTQLEAEKCSSVDAACEPTAACMAAIFAAQAGAPETARILERLGYLLGRWVYLVDALDDYDDDRKSGSYNPFYQAQNGDSLPEELRQEAVATLNLTIAEIGKTYDLLELHGMTGILENIIFQGLRNTSDKFA